MLNFSDCVPVSHNEKHLLETERKVQMPVSENEIRLGQKGDTFRRKKSSR